MPTTTTQNLDVFDAPDVVESYARANDLQPGERTILQEFDGPLRNMRFLDIGIGAGRTTIHFAPRVKEYVGVDYAKEMIKVCEQRFDGEGGRVRFAACDARDMRDFADASFDFAFFSYNGLDCLPHEDRMQILREIHRVVKPGGYYFFSSHNLRFFPILFRFPIFLDVAKMKRRLKKYRLLREHNPNFREIARGRHAFVHDGVHEFRVKIYYVDPEEQVAQLAQTGFREPRLFGENGVEINLSSSRLKRDAWIYYLCRR